jgi:hypothetical protein
VASERRDGKGGEGARRAVRSICTAPPKVELIKPNTSSRKTLTRCSRPAAARRSMAFFGRLGSGSGGGGGERRGMIVLSSAVKAIVVRLLTSKPMP